MKSITLVRIVKWSAVILIVLGFTFWFAFIPPAIEPSYQFETAWGRKGSGQAEFNDPTGIAVAGAEVFVADSRNGRIQVFDLDGNFKRQFGKPGKGPGELSRPMNLRIADGDFL